MRPFELTDAADVQRLAGDRAIADTTLNIPHPYKDGMAEKWIATHRAEFDLGDAAVFAAITRGDEDLVGAIGLTIESRFDIAELGYWIGRPFWGQGYCTEAAMAIVDHGFDTLQLQRIHASHFARNPASGRVLEKLGMKREGIRRRHVSKWGKREDLVDYGLLREEWSPRSR